MMERRFSPDRGILSQNLAFCNRTAPVLLDFSLI
jgi:hypothetical protein